MQQLGGVVGVVLVHLVCAVARYERVMMVSGTFNFEIKGEKSMQIHAGDFVLIPSHRVSQTTCDGPEPCVNFLYTDAPMDIQFVDNNGVEISHDQAYKNYDSYASETAIRLRGRRQHVAQQQTNELRDGATFTVAANRKRAELLFGETNDTVSRFIRATGQSAVPGKSALCSCT